jgi:hypothetical protein
MKYQFSLLIGHFLLNENQRSCQFLLNENQRSSNFANKVFQTYRNAHVTLEEAKGENEHKQE